jgi:hypothetical protein
MMLSKIEGGPFERVKGLVEKAIAAGRHFQSPQTGYIHYFPHQKLGEVHHTIPIYENFLFALALLRSRLVENINEAKLLLTNLLSFQHPQGNFPTYLHEYPHCRDALNGIDILAPLFWTIKHFGHVLGADFRQKLEDSFQKLIEYGLSLHHEHHTPYSMAARYAAGLISGGKLFKNEEWISKGHALLDQLINDQDAWCSTEYFADVLIALQMADIAIFEDEKWKELKDFCVNTWNRQICMYVGPAIRELQLKQEPKPNVYDLFMGNFFGTFSQRSDSLDLYHLQGALIQPIELIHPPTLKSHFEGFYKDQKWNCINEKETALSFLEKKPKQVSLENTYSPLRIVWGDSKFAHTFVCQGCKCSNIEYKMNENSYDLFFQLDREIDLQEKEKQREINFYFDFHPDYKILVNGHTATTFEMGQTVTLELNDHKLTLKFEVVEGSGQFLGHVSHGNRPSQSLHPADLRFEAYDWNLFIRTIRRDAKVRLKATITLAHKKS